MMYGRIRFECTDDDPNDTPAAEARKEQVLRAKWNALDREDDPARRQAKFFRYAMSRGYGYEETKRIYDYLRRD